MQVETYEVISVDEQNGTLIKEEVSEEALALIEELGLDGQRELITERAVDDQTVATRIPYREMSAEERAVFGAILPRQVAVGAYNDGPIPLRVLQVAAHAREHFPSLEVWCPEKASDPDPLLVGYDSSDRYNTRRKVFILARWGEVLEPVDALREKAALLVRTRAEKSIAKAEAALAQFKASLDANIADFILGGRAESVHVGVVIGAARDLF